MKKKREISALQVNPGVSQPPDINPAGRKLTKKPRLTTAQFTEGIRQGNITILSRAITMIESELPEHRKQAYDIINACLPYAGKSIRIGITGMPGAGKSTFIESFGNYLIAQKHKLAVLAIDPSSEKSRGSILGDKTRMETLAVNPMAYVRPSPSKGSLGGVASHTREAMLLCEAAGFDCILIETVGVGQSETLVHSMVDFFLLLQLAGAGDELQGIKRGIMEMADALVITKADGNNVKKAEFSRAQFANALSLFPVPESGIRPTVMTCSSIYNKGIVEIWDYISGYIRQISESGYFHNNRQDQQHYWFRENIKDNLYMHFFHNEAVKKQLPKIEKMISAGTLSSVAAAQQLLDDFFSTTNH
jgi:LAO/AO transport system kinase